MPAITLPEYPRRVVFTASAASMVNDHALRTASGREVRSGDVVSAGDPIVVFPDGTGADVTIGFGADLDLSEGSAPWRGALFDDAQEQQRIADAVEGVIP